MTNTSSLLSVPPEIRLRILEYIFEGLELEIRNRKCVRRMGGNPRFWNIACTCKQLHQETLSVLGARTRLRLWQFLGRDLAWIPVLYRSTTRHLTIFDAEITLKSLKMFTGLRNLHLDRPKGGLRGCWIHPDLTESALAAMQEGQLDEKLKKLGKSTLMERAETRWIRDALKSSWSLIHHHHKCRAALLSQRPPARLL